MTFALNDFSYIFANKNEIRFKNCLFFVHETCFSVRQWRTTHNISLVALIKFQLCAPLQIITCEILQIWKYFLWGKMLISYPDLILRKRVDYMHCSHMDFTHVMQTIFKIIILYESILFSFSYFYFCYWRYEEQPWDTL